MAKKAGEKETVEKAKGFEIPIDEESAGKLLDTIYRSALNGVPKVSRSVDEMVADYTGKAKSPDDAARALAKWQVMKCGTSGFVTGLGGLITLPVAIPANISSVMYVQMRMIACIAKIGGYDVTSDQVPTASDLVKMGLIKTGTKSLEVAIKKIPGSALVKINQKVGFRFITKFGEKGIINLGKMLPLAGGLIGDGVDVASTSIIAKNAIRMFMEGEDPDGTLPTEAEVESIEDVEVESDLL